MTAPDPRQLIAEARKALNGTTPAPWLAATGRNKYGVIGVQGEGRSHALAVFSGIPTNHRAADAKFAAAARTLVPDLCDLAEAALAVAEAARTWEHQSTLAATRALRLAVATWERRTAGADATPHQPILDASPPSELHCCSSEVPRPEEGTRGGRDA